MSYAVYTTESGPAYIEQVNAYLAHNETGRFTATSMLVAQWMDVCPYGNEQCSEVIRYLCDFGY